MLLFWKLVDETQKSTPPEPTKHHNSIKLWILLSLRADLLYILHYETPCIHHSLHKLTNNCPHFFCHYKNNKKIAGKWDSWVCQILKFVSKRQNSMILKVKKWTQRSNSIQIWSILYTWMTESAWDNPFLNRKIFLFFY